MMLRGDVVLVSFPFTDMPQAKRRPALIIQNDRDNQRIRKTVVAMITGNLARAGDPSHLLIDPGTAEGASSGLHVPSLVRATTSTQLSRRASCERMAVWQVI